MAQHDGNKQRGYINYLWLLAGGYLLYLAYKLLRSIWNGTAESMAMNVVGSVMFIAGGGYVLWREWQAYQYAKRHRDDPETWTRDDLPPEEPPAQLPEEEGREEK